jgi:hypothetical protein
MVQNRVFQAARFLRWRLKHCFPSLKLNLSSIIEEIGILWKMPIFEEITSALISDELLDLGVVPCEGVQAEITRLPAVVRVGPNQWSWAMSVVRYAMSSESRMVIQNG